MSKPAILFRVYECFEAACIASNHTCLALIKPFGSFVRRVAVPSNLQYVHIGVATSEPNTRRPLPFGQSDMAPDSIERGSVKPTTPI